MQISRRDLFRTSAALGGAAALGGLGLADAAVAGTSSRAVAVAGTTAERILLKSAPGSTGWRTVTAAAGEAHKVVTGLGVKAKAKRTKTRKSLLAFAQLSDVHICDGQSTFRWDYLDRKDDDDNFDGEIDGHGTYRSAWRPHETLAVHVVDAMVRRINEIGRGPVLGQRLALTLQTGDNSDNNQRNEIRWNIDVLDGATVRADSGDLTKFEGVQDLNDPAFYDIRYWHPDGTPEGMEDDLPRSRYGFPEVPGLLDAARAPFQSEGLVTPWYTAMGNHDGLIQGLKPADAGTQAKATGSTKLITDGNPQKVRTVTADPDRHELSKKEWVEEHFTSRSTDAPGPVGHGLTAENRAKGTAYYTFDKGVVRFIALDTVNPNGAESGSIDPKQLSWLKSVLAKSKKKLVVVFSHHTISTMDNDRTGIVDNTPRVLGPAIRKVLLANENVIAWVNGHTHTNQIWAHKRKEGGGFWEINTASHIDWPQQARLIEIADNKDGTLSIFTTMIDHAGAEEFDGDLENPVQLAALSRLLAANDWQEQGRDRRGALAARNTELIAKAPKFLRPKKKK